MKRLVLAALVSCLGALFVAGGSSAVAQPSSSGQLPTPAGGYWLYLHKHAHTLTTSWVVPTVECTTRSSSVSTSVNLAGETGWARLGVDIDCHDSVPHYKPFSQVDGDRHREILDGVVKPGDMLNLSIKASRDQLSLSLWNDTSGWGSEMVADSGFLPEYGWLVTGQRRSHEHLRALADFSTITYTDTFIDGKPIEGFIYRHRLDGVDGTVKATVSKFDRTHGEGTITWVGK